MASTLNRDFSAEPPSYQDVRHHTAQNGQTAGILSDSPHESDDEETAFLKSELRRLRARNETPSYTISPGRTFVDVQTPQTSTTVHYSNHGPVYQHPTVTVNVPNNATWAERNPEKAPGACLKLCGFFTAILGVIIILLVFIT